MSTGIQEVQIKKFTGAKRRIRDITGGTLGNG